MQAATGRPEGKERILEIERGSTASYFSSSLASPEVSYQLVPEF